VITFFTKKRPPFEEAIAEVDAALKANRLAVMDNKGLIQKRDAFTLKAWSRIDALLDQRLVLMRQREAA
jgi:hypothetical protein